MVSSQVSNWVKILREKNVIWFTIGIFSVWFWYYNLKHAFNSSTIVTVISWLPSMTLREFPFRREDKLCTLFFTYSRIPVTWTLYKSNLPLTRSNFQFSSDHFPHNLTPDNSNFFSISLEGSNYRKSTVLRCAFYGWNKWCRPGPTSQRKKTFFAVNRGFDHQLSSIGRRSKFHPFVF